MLRNRCIGLLHRDYHNGNTTSKIMIPSFILRISVLDIVMYYINASGPMMTSSNGNIFRVTGPLCGEFTGDRWIPHTKASDAELWCFLWINGWVNNREAGDLRRQRAHYDVIVMYCQKWKEQRKMPTPFRTSPFAVLRFSKGIHAL